MNRPYIICHMVIAKFPPITYDPVHHTYRKLGDAVGKAFSDGLKIK